MKSMSSPCAHKRIHRPEQLAHGGGGANTPGDREIRYTSYNADREQKN